MTTQIIPTSTTLADYDQEVLLGDATYLLALRWHERTSAWHLSVSTQDGDPIAMGIPIVVGWSLLARVTDVRRPQGMILAVDTESVDVDPGLADLGDRVLLCFIPDADLAALA